MENLTGITQTILRKLIETAIKASIEAGEIILKFYDNNYETQLKEDSSPLTSADLAANAHINSLLSLTDIPVLSEEGLEIPYNQRKHWTHYWLVDPLDGTKEFIKHNGEFTVNIALISDNKPVIGVIYIPVTSTLYFGLKGKGSYKIQNNGLNTSLFTLEELIIRAEKLPLQKTKTPVHILASRSHINSETSLFVEQICLEFPGSEIISVGSSLKFCLLAEGTAHYYPRFSPTMEWDTAAGHAIAESAGITIKSWPEFKNLEYNKPKLVNPSFIALQTGLPLFKNLRKD